MFTRADELLAYVKDEGVEVIDVRFCDLPGTMQHFTVPVGSFGPEVFEDGLARKVEYRRFGIRGGEGHNDGASMDEDITRRFRRFLERHAYELDLPPAWLAGLRPEFGISRPDFELMVLGPILHRTIDAFECDGFECRD